MGAITVTMRGFDKLKSRLESLLKEPERSVKAGIWNEGQSPGKTPVPLYAFFNEYGTPNAKHPISARPFMRRAWKGERWNIRAYVRNALLDNGSVYSGLVAIGRALSARIKTEIWSNVPPRNADATLKRKPKGLPTLVHTTTMANSVHYRIFRPGEGQ